MGNQKNRITADNFRKDCGNWGPYVAVKQTCITVVVCNIKLYIAV